jgi:hypothetical protein
MPNPDKPSRGGQAGIEKVSRKGAKTQRLFRKFISLFFFASFAALRERCLNPAEAGALQTLVHLPFFLS